MSWRDSKLLDRENIWDRLSHTYPELTNNETGDIASDFYHKYKEDVKLVKEVGVNMRACCFIFHDADFLLIILIIDIICVFTV